MDNPVITGIYGALLQGHTTTDYKDIGNTKIGKSSLNTQDQCFYVCALMLFRSKLKP